MTAQELMHELVEACPVCKGTGTVVDVEWLSHVERGELPPEGSDLRNRPIHIPCPTCEGKGSQLTDLGAMLLNIIRAHL